jgi:hypothetical protein
VECLEPFEFNILSRFDCKCKILYSNKGITQNVVLTTPHLSGIQTHNLIPLLEYNILHLQSNLLNMLNSNGSKHSTDNLHYFNRVQVRVLLMIT